MSKGREFFCIIKISGSKAISGERDLKIFKSLSVLIVIRANEELVAEVDFFSQCFLFQPSMLCFLGGEALC